MNYTDKLRESADKTKSIICMGIDPVPEYLPSRGTEGSIISFFETLFNEMVKKNILPGAFKPNLGFFSALDKPRERNYKGSAALDEILTLLDKAFPDIPVILDFKRGDIARSSENYAKEGFKSWQCDSVTVSPWMGSDSVKPFLKEASRNNGGVYILNRTSNKSANEFQNLVERESGEPLYKLVSKYIIKWAGEYPGTGAVTGATSPAELKSIAALFSGKNIPLLVPGVGSQGGSAAEVMNILKEAEYEIPLVRINISSAITHPWVREGKNIPGDWKEMCVSRLNFFNEEAGGFR